VLCYCNLLVGVWTLVAICSSAGPAIGRAMNRLRSWMPQARSQPQVDEVGVNLISSFRIICWHLVIFTLQCGAIWNGLHRNSKPYIRIAKFLKGNLHKMSRSGSRKYKLIVWVWNLSQISCLIYVSDCVPLSHFFEVDGWSHTHSVVLKYFLHWKASPQKFTRSQTSFIHLLIMTKRLAYRVSGR
jgi:hypothetical protein